MPLNVNKSLPLYRYFSKDESKIVPRITDNKKSLFWQQRLVLPHGSSTTVLLSSEEIKYSGIIYNISSHKAVSI